MDLPRCTVRSPPATWPTGHQALQGGRDVTRLDARVGLCDPGDVHARLALDRAQHLELDLVLDTHAGHP